MNNIRTLNLDDLASYKSLLSGEHHTYSWDRYYLDHVSDEALTKILSSETAHINVFGAFEDDVLVATATLRQSKYVGKQHKAVILNNFVKDNDEVINRELINYIIHFAEQKNLETILTSVTSSNISAKVFFSSLGFENLGFEKNASKIGDEYFDEHWLSYDLRKS
ncbi:GNAT family N-acetyltransferase [Staphylococcus warneri]|uniref:GNAT family N-acetyltransferase n=1 Tax=Staphylococcus warneri TaxID=1292 RepID=UPI00214B6DA3|nr:GNAT family N-acetyltransferase [Staphylococcus warneri]MCR1796162.1 GNAT family N-acetyltransferase [Staphylococcus warneri]MCT2595692.1 GNAT family N-acetyltransferase [Staphylococcus warneri]